MDTDYGNPCLPVETLRFEDETIGPFWQHREIVPASMMQIIDDWKAGHLSSTEALKRLDLQDMLDPNDLMLGLAAVIAAGKGARV